MRHPKLVTVLCTLATLALAHPAAGRSVRWYRGLKGPIATGSAEQAARAYLANRASALRLAGVDLAPAARQIAWRGHRIVRIGQEHEGLPVFGREVVVRVDRQGRVQTVATNAVPPLSVVTLPALDADEAAGNAALAWGVGQLSFVHATLGVLTAFEPATLVWQVDGAVGLLGNRTYVDAVTGEVVSKFWLVHSAQGRVYRDNPVATPTPEVLDLIGLDQDATSLTGDWVTVYRHAGGNLNQMTGGSLTDLDLTQTAVADGNGDFLYQPTLDASQPDYADPYAEVNAYYHLNRIYAYFRDEHGYSSNRPHIGIANFATYNNSLPTPYDNAYFSEIDNDYVFAIGQGSHVDLAYDGDVLYHEFGHSVITNLSQMGSMFDMFDVYGMNTGPGGIQEGMADYWSGSLTDDSQIGEYSLEGIEAGASRDMDNDLRCPDDIWGESHMDGEPLGAAAWSVRTVVGDRVTADAVLYGALTTAPSNSSYADLAAAIIDAANAMVSDGDLTQTVADQIATALADRGMTTCDRDVPLDDGPQHTGLLYNFQFIAAMASQYGGGNVTCEQARTNGISFMGQTVQVPPIPYNFQFRKTVPAGATSLTFRVQHAPSSDLYFWVYVRKAELVRYTMQSLFFGMSVPVAHDYDYSFGPLEDGDTTVTIDQSSDPPLEPGATYYVALTQQNCTINMQGAMGTETVVTVSADTATETPDAGVTPDASAPDAGTDDHPKHGGCGCDTGRGSAPAAPLGLALGGLLIFAVIRRRRR